MSQEILIALQTVHDRMRDRMMRHPEFCAMLALEKSIESISEILAPPVTESQTAADQDIEHAIAETIATKVAPASTSAPQTVAPTQRLPTAPFFPQHRVVGGQAAMGMR